MDDGTNEGARPAAQVQPPGRARGAIAIGVAIAAGTVVLLLFGGKERRPPDLSPTLEHRAALGGRNAQACLSCHARGSAPRRSQGHTGREDCWSCHVVAE